MKRMVRVGTLAVLVLLTACGDSQSHPDQLPKAVLSQYFHAMRTGELKAAYSLVSSADKAVKTLDQFQASTTVTGNDAKAAFTRAFRKATSRKILAVNTQGDRAEASVSVTLPDIKTIYKTLVTSQMASALGDANSTPSSASMTNALITKIKSGAFPTVQTKRQFVLRREQQGWRVYLDWAADKVEALLKAAKQLRDDNDLAGARKKYKAALAINPHSEAAKAGLETVENTIAYLDAVALDNLKAHYHQVWLDERAAEVSFEIRNTGDRTLSEVAVTVYFQDASGQTIHEEKYYPVQAASFLSGDAPLRPGYIWQASTSMSVPSEWQEGAVKARVTGITFTKQAEDIRAKRPEKAMGYADKIEVYDLAAAYHDSHPSEPGRLAGVTFKLRNKGKRTVADVDVTIYFLNASGKAIHEKQYTPLSMGVSLGAYSGNDSPLRPGYIWQLGHLPFLPASSVPEEWKPGAVKAKITGVEFAKATH